MFYIDSPGCGNFPKQFKETPKYQKKRSPIPRKKIRNRLKRKAFEGTFDPFGSIASFYVFSNKNKRFFFK